MEQVYENENSFTGKIKNLVNFFIKKVKDFFREKLGIKLDVSARELYGIARDILAKSTVKSILQGKVARQKMYDKSNVYEEEPVFAKVENKSLLDKLNTEPTIKAYRAMQLIDGKLYPPMATYVDGKLVEPTELNTWYMADGHPELLLVKVGEKYIPIEKYLKENNNVMPDDSKLFFKLGKGKDDSGKSGFIQARYNPYWHASLSPLNDQFKATWNRSNMVTVEVEIPLSELSSKYMAKYAKDPVGETEWKSGSVSGQLAKLGKPRKVILSRYNKVVRIIPNNELAGVIAKQLNGTGIKIPINTVTTQLKNELEKLGVEFAPPEKGAPKQETNAKENKISLEKVKEIANTVVEKAKKENRFESIREKLLKPIINIIPNTVKTNGLRIKDAAVEWFNNNPISNANTEIGEVIINANTIADSFNHTKYQNKLDTLLAIKPVLESGTYLGEYPDIEGKPLKNHYFAAKIKIGKDEQILFIRTREARKSSNRFYVHEVFTEKEIKE